MNLKTITAPFTLKADDESGAFSVVFSTTGVVDKDRDIVLDSAIADGIKLPLLQGHQWTSLAVGAGTTRTDGASKILDGQFFLDTSDGANAYKTTKGLIAAGVNQEFSWGFKVDERREPSKEERSAGAENVIVQATPREVSLVLVGAGEGTTVQSLKSFDEQITATLAAIDDVIVRAGIRAAHRQENDRPIGKADVARLESLQAKLLELLTLASKTTAIEPAQEGLESLSAIRLRYEIGYFE